MDNKKKGINKIIGIYKITNTANGKIYIGQSENVKARLKTHERAIENHYNSNPVLNEDTYKYKPEDFTLEIIEECDKKDLLKKEEQYIKQYIDEGKELYNIFGNKFHEKVNPEYSVMSTKETRDKLSDEEVLEKMHNRCRDTVWLNNGVKNYRAKADEIEKYKQMGYTEGFICKYTPPVFTEEEKEKHRQAKIESKHDTVIMHHKDFPNNKYVKLTQMQEYLDSGWECGKKERTSYTVYPLTNGLINKKILYKNYRYGDFDINEYPGYRIGYTNLKQIVDIEVPKERKICVYSPNTGKKYFINPYEINTYINAGWLVPKEYI